ncbi:MAG: thioredoxin domain-containing protein, partial [Polyangiales bacterium]
AFFCTQDADSVPTGAAPGTHPEEGAFFVWTPEQVREVLGADEEASKVAVLHLGITARGNFEEGGATVLSEVMPLEDVALQLGIEADAAKAAFTRARLALFDARELRPKPFRDEKILAGWNGLMIGACAEVAIATGDEQACSMAKRAFAAVTKRLLRGDRLVRVAGSKIPGFLDDYAYLASAALDLYEATQDGAMVDVARKLVAAAVAHFWDDALGGFFFTPDDGEKLLHRTKDPYDQAVPSAQAMMALAMLRLFSLDADPQLEDRARRTLEPMAALAASNPLGLSQTVIALDRLVRGSTDVVVVGPRDDTRTKSLLQAVRRAYVPHRMLALVDPDDAATTKACPALAEGKEAKGHPVAYVCRGRTCSPPVADAAALAAALHAGK